MDDKDFETLVEKAILDLPEEFSNMLDNVNVIVSDWPTGNQRRALRGSNNSLLLGLYEGIPKTKRGSYGVGGAIPDKITIFKIPILMIARNIDEIKYQIKDTVMHEIGHHFGLSDEDIGKVKQKST